MGTQTYEPGAPDTKVRYELSKYPEQHILGFRVTGMRLYRPDTDSYAIFDKHHGRSFGNGNVHTLFRFSAVQIVFSF